MKIAILGTRGIPASYSGFETAVEQLAARLSARGHEVVVYCRPHVVDRRLDEYRGAQLIHQPVLVPDSRPAAVSDAGLVQLPEPAAQEASLRRRVG